MVAAWSFTTPKYSEHFHWRNAKYPNYIDLMPVCGLNEKVVVNYGCGPGNDLAGFSLFSKLSTIYGIDVSGPALKLASKRLELHKASVEFIKLDEVENKIPLEDHSVDYIHQEFSITA